MQLLEEGKEKKKKRLTSVLNKLTCENQPYFQGQFKDFFYYKCVIPPNQKISFIQNKCQHEAFVKLQPPHNKLNSLLL